ncbi:MAG: hypothetical protein ACLR9W_05985 [Enterobacter hormaechei]
MKLCLFANWQLNSGVERTLRVTFGTSDVSSTWIATRQQPAPDKGTCLRVSYPTPSRERINLCPAAYASRAVSDCRRRRSPGEANAGRGFASAGAHPVDEILFAVVQLAGYIPISSPTTGAPRPP